MSLFSAVEWKEETERGGWGGRCQFWILSAAWVLLWKLDRAPHSLPLWQWIVELYSLMIEAALLFNPNTSTMLRISLSSFTILKYY